MAKNVLLACLSHESNGFVKGTTPLSACTIRRGAEVFLCRGDQSACAGALQNAEEQGWNVVPTIDISAWPSAPAEDAVLDAFLQDVQSIVEGFTGQLDGVLLVMHGAMLAVSHPDAEGFVVATLRRHLRLASLPMVGVFDLHGNPSREMVEALDAVVVYRRSPHDDIHEAGARGAQVLGRLMTSGRRGHAVRSSPGVMWSPLGAGTDDVPMSILEAAARAVERQDKDVLEAAVFAGFPYADHPDVGVSICVSTIGDPESARNHARALATLAYEHRHAGNCRGESLAIVIERIRAAPPGPVVIAEPSDNIGAGTQGDSTGLLRALLDQDVGGTCLIVICDPDAIAALNDHAPGGQHRIAIGGRGFTGDPGPVERIWEFRSRSSGSFSLENLASPLANYHGSTVQMGPCVVLSAGQVQVLVTSRPTAPWDLGQLRSQGLIPEQARVIVVKSAVAHRMAYKPIGRTWLSVETPGPSATDLTTFTYRQVGRPVYPHDPAAGCRMSSW